MPADLPSSLTSESTAVRCGTMTYLIFVTCAVRSKNIKKRPKNWDFSRIRPPTHPVRCKKSERTQKQLLWALFGIHAILGVKFSSLKMCMCKNIRYVQRGSEVRTSHNCTIEQLHIVCHVQGFSRPVQKRKECLLKNLMQRMHTVCRKSGFCQVLLGFVRFCQVLPGHGHGAPLFCKIFSPCLSSGHRVPAGGICNWESFSRKFTFSDEIFQLTRFEPNVTSDV